MLRRKNTYQPTSSTWYNVSDFLSAWKTNTSFFRDAKICCYCSAFKFGGSKTKLLLYDPSEHPGTQHASHPPSAIANIFLLDYVETDDDWWICTIYKKDIDGVSRRRTTQCKEYLVFMTPTYIKLVLSADPLLLQHLSLVDIKHLVVKKYKNVAQGYTHTQSILEAPLVASSSRSRNVSDMDVRAYLQPLLLQNKETNPLFKKYLPLVELPDTRHRLPVISIESISHIVNHSMEL